MLWVAATKMSPWGSGKQFWVSFHFAHYLSKPGLSELCGCQNEVISEEDDECCDPTGNSTGDFALARYVIC